MPLVRVQVRNEFGLGRPELYKEANREDPKALLDGVAVAGLVGILRQLGDLAEFAAEVFHGLQEQVMSTCSRSHKLMVRVQRLEAALPPFEKAILAQKSHLHFAYTAGSDSHVHLQNDQNHFIYGDLPQFIMDSYEYCRDPPRLHLLDKFDAGGPGSCLKRYSDPTFFTRASTSFVDVNVKRVAKDSKPHRSKKKRKWQNTEMHCGAPISIQSERNQFTSLKVDERISPSQPVSAFDGTMKSDLGGQSNSSGSGTGSGHIECIVRPTYSLKNEEHEHEESIISRRMHDNDTFEAASLDDHNRVLNDSAQSLSLEQADPSSSSLTWDEKMEIIDSMNYRYDHAETTEILPMNLDSDTQEKGAVSFKNDDELELQLDVEDKTASISGQNQLDDIDSEPDNYVDALNTIESESETDLVCQTKREVEQSPNLNDNRTRDRMHGRAADHSDLQPSDLEPYKETHNLPSKVTSFEKPKSMPSESCVHQESPHMTQKSSNIHNALVMESIEVCGKDKIFHGSNVGSGVSNLSGYGPKEPNPPAPVTDHIISTSTESHKSPPKPSGIQPVKIWTNGGLLGLEPSKPPDFNARNAVNQDFLTKSEDNTTNPSSQCNMLNGGGDSNKLVQRSKGIEQISFKSSMSCNNDPDGISDRTAWKFLPTYLDAKYQKHGDSHLSNSFNDDREHILSQTCAVIPGTQQAVTPDARAVSSGAGQRNTENTSQMFGLGNSSSVNGFQGNMSLFHDEKSEPPSSRKSNIFEQKSKNQSIEYRTFSERNFKRYFVSASPLNSPSSPPLQHMKISFQPIDGFETAKLRLKFPDGRYSFDNSRDMLPSFQLVPEAATPNRESGSESDNDTFCRSSPYISDDCLSHHSESSSEQWESDYIPANKNNEIYDSFRRISLTESASSYFELEGTERGSIHVENEVPSLNGENCSEPHQSGHSLQLPNLSTLNPLFEQEMAKGSDTKNFPESHLLEEPTPLPPPLPPLQWRIMKSLSDANIGKHKSVSEAANNVFDMKRLGFALPPQSMPGASKKQQSTDEHFAVTPDSKPEWHILDRQKEVNKAINGRGVNEKEDFLHQIRTKSFSLRSTTTERPTATVGPTANVKVTAILEKANAIRQAVGSDDENWSDT